MAKIETQTVVIVAMVVIAVVALVGLLLSLGVVKTGNGVHEIEPVIEEPTAAFCLPGAVKARAHSELHTAMRTAGMNCEQSVYPQYVCCMSQ